MKLQLKPHGTTRLKLDCDGLLSNSAFKFKLRRYSKGMDGASTKDAASNSREDVTNLAINGPRALPPKSEALVAATAAAAAAAAVDVAEGNKPKRRFGLNMKSALQAVAGILGKKIDTLDPGTVLGHRMTW
jgi:hypothetical protein